jgi:hypothetical protein
VIPLARITANAPDDLVLTGAPGLPLAGVHTAGCEAVNRPETRGGPTPDERDLSADAIRDLPGPGADDSLDPVSGPRGR